MRPRSRDFQTLTLKLTEGDASCPWSDGPEIALRTGKLNPLLPRPKGDKDAEGMKKQIPSSKCPKFEPPT